METGGRWPVAASLGKKICYYFWVFSHFYFAECKSLPSAFPALGEGFAECPLPSAALGKAFAECISGFAECHRHSAKLGIPVMTGMKLWGNSFSRIDILSSSRMPTLYVTNSLIQFLLQLLISFQDAGKFVCCLQFQCVHAFGPVPHSKYWASLPSLFFHFSATISFLRCLYFYFRCLFCSPFQLIVHRKILWIWRVLWC